VKLWYTRNNSSDTVGHQAKEIDNLGETNLCSLQRAFSLLSACSVDKLFKDKFTWKSQYYYLWIIKRPRSEPNSPVAPTWRNVTSNRVRQLWWICGLCMKHICHCVTHAVQRGKTETYGPKFRFLASIVLCVDHSILCIVHKWNLSVWHVWTYKQCFTMFTIKGSSMSGD
jgi:hypothetical protein